MLTNALCRIKCDYIKDNLITNFTLCTIWTHFSSTVQLTHLLRLSKIKKIDTHTKTKSWINTQTKKKHHHRILYAFYICITFDFDLRTDEQFLMHTVIWLQISYGMELKFSSLFTYLEPDYSLDFSMNFKITAWFCFT